MEGVLGGDDLVLLRVFPGLCLSVKSGQFDEDFVGLGPAVAEENLTGSRIPTDLLGEEGLIGNSVKVAAMSEFTDLLSDAFNPKWVAVAD